MTVKLKELVQMLNECENDSPDDECIACKLFGTMCDDTFEITSGKTSLSYSDSSQPSLVKNPVLKKKDEIWQGQTSD